MIRPVNVGRCGLTVCAVTLQPYTVGSGLQCAAGVDADEHYGGDGDEAGSAVVASVFETAG